MSCTNRPFRPLPSSLWESPAARTAANERVPIGNRSRHCALSKACPRRRCRTSPLTRSRPPPGGTPTRLAEVGETLTAGVIVRPGFEQPWLRELQFTVDWYQIEIENSVTYVDAVTAVGHCFDPKYNANFSATNY